MSMREFAKAIIEMAEMAIEHSSPDQREAWIRDLIKTGFKGTSQEGKEQEFLDHYEERNQLTVVETARLSPNSFRAIMMVGNNKIKEVKSADKAVLRQRTPSR